MVRRLRTIGTLCIAFETLVTPAVEIGLAPGSRPIVPPCTSGDDNFELSVAVAGTGNERSARLRTLEGRPEDYHVYCGDYPAGLEREREAGAFRIAMDPAAAGSMAANIRIMASNHDVVLHALPCP